MSIEKYEIKQVAYYEVNNKQFTNKSDAEEYALKIFIVENLTKVWAKDRYCQKYLICVESDGEFLEAIPDGYKWKSNCCNSKVIGGDNTLYKRFKNIKDLYTYNKQYIERIFNASDSIDVDKLSLICDEDAIRRVILYKNMVDKIKHIIK